ncbi:DMT family transporter [Dongia soli]|uniref:DMT family transporter n=1 Tax=Dongia soli TaxID=600628 RepID=A0ABU5E4X3_9PROT|nr:DMT family transporter [Dongia soli]MDY0881322.1 DMT family transporter [Dongia soli]
MPHDKDPRPANDQHIWAGLAFGFVGCAIFAGSLPATRLAVSAFDPVLVTAGRAAIAGLMSVGLLALRRQAWPGLRLWGQLVIVAIGVVVGFPLFSAYAVQLVPASHGIVFVGLLPLMTATAAVLRGGERPKPLFWLFAIGGGLIIMAYALIQGWRDGHDLRLQPADFDMLLAVLLCGLGYAEGAVLARRLGSWQVICWALVLSLPVMLPLFVWLWLETGESLAHVAEAGPGPLLGFAYVCLFSMFIGFFFWYHGLKLGGIARVGQLQLIQGFLGFGLAALILGETVPPSALIAVGLIVCCILGARKFA